jgi:transcriptional regulator with XRE-family HTH domain
MKDKDYLKKLGENIVKMRTMKKISQVGLSDLCGFEKSNMRRIEAGNTNPTIKTLLKIAEALEVTIIDLLTF